MTNEKRILFALNGREEQLLLKRLILGLDENGLTKILIPSLVTIKQGTVFYVEFEKINDQYWLTEGINVVSYNDAGFKSKILSELEADKGYVAINKPLEGQLLQGISTDIYPHVSVLIWVRSLSNATDENSELKGTIMDLTPFVESVITNVSHNGGNFSIKLPPITCDIDENNKWSLRKANINQTKNGDEYYASSSMFNTDDKGNLNLNSFFFHTAIKSNDLVWIRYETLKIEAKQRYDDAKTYFIDKSMLPNRIYDMIGLVDSNTETINPQNNDVTINVTGRDLSKLFIEDGTYFYAWESSQGMLKLAGGSQQQNDLIQRIFSNNGAFIDTYNFKHIDYILKFIIQQLSSIKIVPNDLFEAYGERRSKKFIQKNNINTLNPNQKNYTKEWKEELANGLWQLLDLNIDNNISSRITADSSMSSSQGSILNFIRTAVQEPLAEFFMDTYGDRFVITCRKPPTDQSSIISMLEGRPETEDGVPAIQPAIIDILASDVLQSNLVNNDSQIYSWYHFIPKSGILGTDDSTSTMLLPAVFLKEYADIWGSKPFQQVHNYLPFELLQSNEEDACYKQCTNDLKFVIESNQYTPFTRKGTITISGDRRIKIGNFIRYLPTSEIFYVEHVQQNFAINGNSIERTTTIQVTRGMVESLIYGVHLSAEDGSTKFVSYFNLVDTRLNYEK